MIKLQPNFDINSHIYMHIQPQDGNDFCIFMPAGYIKIPASIPDTELRRLIIDLWLKENLTIDCDMDITMKCLCFVSNTRPNINGTRQVIYVHHKTDSLYSIILPETINPGANVEIDQWVDDRLILDKIDKTTIME